MNVFSGTIDQCYKQLILALLNLDVNADNTRELENVILDIQNPQLHDFSLPFRRISKTYANAELKWYWSADNSCKTIGQHAKMWLRISDDHETSNSAYGYILHQKHGKDQIQEVIELLKKDKWSRKAVLSLTDPTLDKLTTKDFQCTIALHVLIRDDSLHLTVYMRSNDVYFGLPYDYIYFTSIGQYIADKLNVKFTNYKHVVTSMHMYERDASKFIDLLNEQEPERLSIDAKSIIKENYDESY